VPNDNLQSYIIILRCTLVSHKYQISRAKGYETAVLYYTSELVNEGISQQE